ncbi:MAG: PDZ domain-containing protein [candidate division Zixibacteria bacterium]|nr:PDZ domain-containing protein [candidate division Zixibacteria bacterium]
MRHNTKVLLSAVLVVTLLVVTAGARSGRSDGAWLGVYTQTVDKDLAEAFDLAVDYGCIINDVVEDSPADEAGLREDDIIISLNGQKIRTAKELTDLLDESQTGDKAELVIMRDDDEKTITAVLGDKPDRYYIAPRMGKLPKSGKDLFFFDTKYRRSFIGVSLAGLSDQLGEYFGAEEGRGALITEVEEGSPAEKAGLRAGDVIVAVGDERVKDYGDVQEMISELDPGDTAKIRVLRDKKETDITVEVGESKDYDFGSYFHGAVPVPDVDVYIPKMKGLHRSFESDLDAYFDSDQFQEEMEQLKKQMKALKKELEVLREKLE